MPFYIFEQNSIVFQIQFDTHLSCLAKAFTFLICILKTFIESMIKPHSLYGMENNFSIIEQTKMIN